MIPTTAEDHPPLFVPGRRVCYACANGITGYERLCYACAHDLTGEPKGGDEDEVWECRCWGEVWECRCEDAAMAYCPICGERFAESAYLATVFAGDERARWLANMVTHYRHEHRAWDRSHPYLTRRYGEATYERQKQKINEQAKRQIIRKATAYLLHHGVQPEHFALLEGTENKTLALAHKKLMSHPASAPESCGC